MTGWLRFRRRASALGFCVTLALALQCPAQAADPLRGAALFANAPAKDLLGCADCHSANPTVSNFGNIFVGRNAVALIQRAVGFNTGGMGYLGRYYNAGDFADIAAYLGNTPGSLRFGLTPLGGTSAAQAVTVNTSTKAGIGKLAFSTDGDFIIVGGHCGSALDSISTCAVEVTFRPAASGLRSGALLIAHDGTPSPIRIALSGEAPQRPPAVASVTPASMDFRGAAVGATGARRNAVLANDSNELLTLGAIRTSMRDFAVVGGSCAAGMTLPPGQRCAVALRFEPVAAGARSATLTITHDGVGGAASVALSGNAPSASAGAVRANPSAIDFGSVDTSSRAAAQVLTLLNPGPGAWTMTDMSTTNPAFAIERTSCSRGTALAAQQSCQVSVTFRPARPGLANGELRLSSAGTSSPMRIPLSAHATQANALLSAVPPRLGLDEVVGQSVTSRFTLVNRGSAATRLASLSISGPEAGDFFILPDGTCQPGSPLEAGMNCSVSLRFAPRSVGGRLARLRIQHGADATGTVVELFGQGRAAAAARLWVDASAIEFAERAIGAKAPAEVLRVSVQNRGRAALAWKMLGVSGDHRADFPVAGDCQAQLPLAAGGACRVELTFLPGSAGDRAASLVMQAADADTATIVNLAGRGVASGQAQLSLDTLVMDFGRQAIQGSPVSRRVSVRNRGSAATGALPLAVEGPFVIAKVDDGCTRGLAAGEPCGVDLQFVPTRSGPATGRLSVRTAGSAQAAPLAEVALAGEAVDAAPALGWQPVLATPIQASAVVGEVAALRVMTLVNRGNAPSAALQWALSGPAATDYSLDTGNGCPSGTVLAAGASCSLRLLFHPGGPGPRAAWLSPGADAPSLTLQLQARGWAPASADLRARPDAVAFEAFVATPTATQWVLLRNEGTALLSISSLATPGQAFTWSATAGDACSGESFALLPGESCAVEVAWLGTAAGSAGGSLTVSGGDAFGSLSVPLSVREDPAQRTNVGSTGGGASSTAMLLGVALGVLLLKRARRP